MVRSLLSAALVAGLLASGAATAQAAPSRTTIVTHRGTSPIVGSVTGGYGYAVWSEKSSSGEHRLAILGPTGKPRKVALGGQVFNPVRVVQFAGAAPDTPHAYALAERCDGSACATVVVDLAAGAVTPAPELLSALGPKLYGTRLTTVEDGRTFIVDRIAPPAGSAPRTPDTCAPAVLDRATGAKTTLPAPPHCGTLSKFEVRGRFLTLWSGSYSDDGMSYTDTAMMLDLLDLPRGWFVVGGTFGTRSGGGGTQDAVIAGDDMYELDVDSPDEEWGGEARPTKLLGRALLLGQPSPERAALKKLTGKLEYISLASRGTDLVAIASGTKRIKVGKKRRTVEETRVVRLTLS